MPYTLIGKATVHTPEFKCAKGEQITDAQYKTLDARRQAWFEKIVEKAKKSRRKSPVQPLPVEPPTTDPKPVE